MPNMAIIDADMMMEMPPRLTAASGVDALTHALEAYVSMLRTEPADGLALQAGKIIFEYLPRAYKNGKNDKEARENGNGIYYGRNVFCKCLLRNMSLFST